MEQVLERIFQRVELIPTFPKVAQQALEILREDDIDFNQLEQVIKSDPGIVANFLKIANSPAFSRYQKISRLKDAFLVLGVNQIRFILLASISEKYFKTDLDGYGVTAKEIWLHSIITGCIAEEIALKVGLFPEDMEKVYIAAILHDIGKIVLDLYLNVDFQEFKEVMEKHPDWSFLEVELFILGIDHGLLGGYLFQRWEFDPEISFAVRAHHDPSLMVQHKVSAITGMANIISNLIGLKGDIDSFYYELPENLLTFLRIDEKDFKDIIKKAFIRAQILEKTY